MSFTLQVRDLQATLLGDPLDIALAIKLSDQKRTRKEQMAADSVFIINMMQFYLKPDVTKFELSASGNLQISLVWTGMIDLYQVFEFSTVGPSVSQIYPQPTYVKPFKWEVGYVGVTDLYNFLTLGCISSKGNLQTIIDGITDGVDYLAYDPGNWIGLAMLEAITVVLEDNWYVAPLDKSKGMGSLYRASINQALNMYSLSKQYDNLFDYYNSLEVSKTSIDNFIVHTQSDQTSHKISDLYYQAIAILIGIATDYARVQKYKVDPTLVSNLQNEFLVERGNTVEPSVIECDFVFYIINTVRHKLVPIALMYDRPYFDGGRLEDMLLETKKILIKGLQERTNPLAAMREFVSAVESSNIYAPRVDFLY